jgi:short-subunit dehydrogenase
MNPPQTVLVTGGSSGIGLELARCFAHAGDRVIITGRSPETLAAALTSLRATGAEIIGIPAELGTEAGITAFLAALSAQAPVVDVLVNNAGFGVHGHALLTDPADELALTTVHILAPWRLTRALLPGMVERRCGGVLNVGSVYSFSPAPWQAVYGAAKAWLWSYSLALREELRGTGVTITALCPGTTLSQFRVRMGQRDRASWLSATCTEVARAGHAGFRHGRAIVVPGRWNQLYVWVVRRLPSAWLGRFVYHTAYRLRGMPVPSLSP